LSKNKPKLAIVGAGKMGEAIISGFLKSGEYDPQDIQVFEILKSRREYIGQTYNVKCVGDSKEAVSFSFSGSSHLTMRSLGKAFHRSQRLKPRPPMNVSFIN